MGYKVGKQGATPERRREILRSAIEDQWSSHVRRVIPEDQLKEWGDPGQDRYRKLLNKLSGQIDTRDWRSDRHRWSETISQWSEDLQWVRDTFGKKYGP